MAKRRKGRVPPQLRQFLFKKKSRKGRGRSVSVAKKHKRKGRSHGAGISFMEPALGFGYGFVRGKLGQMAAPLIAKVPGGAYADNIVLGGGVYLLDRFHVIPPALKPAAKVIVTCEAFQAGVKASAGISLTAGGSTVTAGGGVPTLQ